MSNPNLDLIVNAIEKVIDTKLLAFRQTTMNEYNQLRLDYKELDGKLDTLLMSANSQKRSVKDKKEKSTKDGEGTEVAGSNSTTVVLNAVRPKTAPSYFKDMWADQTEIGERFRTTYTMQDGLDVINKLEEVQKKKVGEQRNKYIGDKMLTWIKNNNKALYDQFVVEHTKYKEDLKAPKETAQAQVEPGSPKAS